MAINIKVNFDTKAFKAGAEEIKKATADIESALEGVATKAGIAFAAFTAGGAAAVKAFADFETGLVGVAKTTGITGKELESLGKTLQDTSKELPVATDELLAIAQSAGQLGVTGAANIEKFAITIAKLGRASDLEGEAAATQLTRILTVTGDGVGTIDRFASVIVALGNNFAATEGEIAQVATRLSATTAVFNLGATNVAAISTALKALGVNAELGSSAVGRAFQAIDKSLREGGKGFEELQKLTGLTGEQLRKTFQEDSTEVFRLFVGGLNKVTESGDSVAETLETLGLTGVGVNQVFGALSQGSDTLNSALKLAGDEAKNATALNKEFEAATQTLNSAFILVKNNLVVLGQEIGARFAPFVEKAARAFSNFVGFLSENEGFADFLAFVLAAGAALTSLIAGLATGALVFIKLSAAVKIAIVAFKALSVAASLSLGPISLLIAALTALTVFIIANFDKISKVFEIFAANVRNLFGGVGDIIVGVFTLDNEKIASGIAQAKDAVVESIADAVEAVKELDEENKDEQGRNAVEQALSPRPEKIQEDFDNTRQVIEDNVAELQARAIERAELEKEALRELENDKQKIAKDSYKKFIKDRQQFGVAIATINEVINSDEVQGTKKATGELVALQQSKSKELKAIGKAAAVAQIIINTATSASNIYQGFSSIPIIGPILGVAGAAAAIAFGAEQIGKVTAAQDGGLITGGIPGVDSVPALLQQGEVVVPRQNFEEVLNAVSAQREASAANEGEGAAVGGARISVEFESEEASRIITAQQTEDTALGVSRQEIA